MNKDVLIKKIAAAALLSILIITGLFIVEKSTANAVSIPLQVGNKPFGGVITNIERCAGAILITVSGGDYGGTFLLAEPIATLISTGGGKGNAVAGLAVYTGTYCVTYDDNGDIKFTGSGYVVTQFGIDRRSKYSISPDGNVTPVTTPPPTDTSPQITSLSPESAVFGTPGFLLTINGKNFSSSSTVTFNDKSKSVIFKNTNTLQISVSASDIAAPGIIIIIITNPNGETGTDVFAVNEASKSGTGTTSTTIPLFVNENAPSLAPIISWLESAANSSTTPPLPKGFTSLYSAETGSATAFPKTVTVNIPKLSIRTQPNTTSALGGSRYLRNNDTFTAKSWVDGESVGGEKRWWVSTKGNYVWVGGTKEKPSGTSPSSTTTPATPAPTYRKVTINIDIASIRTGPKTSAPLGGSQYLYYGDSFNAKSYVIGEKVSGENRWWVTTKGNYIWVGATAEKP